MPELLRDLQHGARLLVRNPGFSAIAVAVLALGIGANTAIFSVVNAVLLRPLPFPAPERLVELNRMIRGQESGPYFTGREYFFLRDNLKSFEAVASTMMSGGLNLVHNGQAEYVIATKATPEFFTAIGVQPSLGRAFRGEEADFVVLRHELWQRRFGGDPGILNRGVNLGGRVYTVAGVMPAGFRPIPEADLWLPLRPGPGDGGTNRHVFARLKPGVTRAQAQAEVDTLAPVMFQQFGRQIKGETAPRVTAYLREEAAYLETPLLLLMGAAGLVLLIACGNVTNLLLARAATRVRELAIRAALGAGRGRLIRQMIAESLLLAGAGGAAGLAVAYWLLPALLRLSPRQFDLVEHASLDWRVALFAAAAAAVTGILFGLVPALRVTRLDLSQAVKEGSARTTAGRGSGRLRQGLIVAEVALSMILLVGAVLLLRTLGNVLAIQPGFDPRQVLAGQMSLAGPDFDTTAKVATMMRAAMGRLRERPNVDSAAVILNIPLERGLNLPCWLPGQADMRITDYRYITPDFFRVMGTPLRAGRLLTAADNAGSERVLVVNQRFADRYFPKADPLGQSIRLDRAGPEHRIVGVVADMKQTGLDKPAVPTVYQQLDQVEDGLQRLAHQWFQASIVVKFRDGDASAQIAALQQDLRAANPLQPFSGFRTMEDQIRRSVAERRFYMLLLGGFAALALVLAAAGIYGVVSYLVVQRTAEIGIRMALGATAARLAWGTIGEGARLAGIGVVLGLAGSVAATRLLASLLYGVSQNDPATFGFAAAALLATAATASAVPAWRAARLDPVVALRRE